ncbi:GNAT family N-acetyltransferase [Veronia nyctiphanis]|uniref:GNAT family N-acetyltransferase n=1 Tax=Veronia nyctiphanis TaxID=1278244 RepID=A0A4Q0YNX7_9GAMM|nr:GNAT family N-acetyltransferase [Veronia nyctiphanis]RXJ72687.1 GNAT family N-acetyltransferase [Veronia nyctiphanis]
MQLRFEPVEDPFGDEVFQMMKSGLYPFVEEVFGWDEEFQKRRMRDDYKAEWFYWVLDQTEKVGFVCFKPYDESLHLHLVVVMVPFQGRGYGKLIMHKIHEVAQTESRDITLSCFKKNERAVRLYQSLSYQLTAEEEHFYSFKRSNSNQEGC